MVRKPIVALVTLALALALVAEASAQPEAPAGQQIQALLSQLAMQVPREPTAAPVFTLRDLTGAEVHLADLRGKVVVLYFWTTY